MRTTTWTAPLGRRSPQKLRRHPFNRQDHAHWYDAAFAARMIILVLLVLTLLAIAWTFLMRIAPGQLIAALVSGVFQTFGWHGVA